MKRFFALCLIGMLVLSAARAEEQVEYVEPAGDGSEFTDSPESLISSAMEIYSWFVMWPLDIDETLPSEDGTMYRLLDERFCNRAEMDKLLNEYFCQEIQDELWAWNAYTEIDGFLYAAADVEYRASDERIESVSYALTNETDDHREYTVTVIYTDDGDEYTPEEETLLYVQKKIDGTWQFTEFPFFW